MWFSQVVLVVNEFTMKKRLGVGCEVKCTNWSSGEECLMTRSLHRMPSTHTVTLAVSFLWRLLTSPVKSLSNTNESQRKAHYMIREIALFKQLTHPNIVKFVKVRHVACSHIATRLGSWSSGKKVVVKGSGFAGN